MKQSERRAKSRTAILDAAFAEFGERGYAGATVDGVCARGSISKGMMYHYYKGKDELFCECVKEMFSALAGCLGEYLENPDDGDAEALFSGYFMSRERFFAANPNMRAVFEDAVLRTPPQLADEIKRLRGPMRERNRELLNRMLEKTRLRPGISESETRRWFDAVEALLPELMLRLCEGGGSAEEQAKLVLGMLLFGILDG